VITALGAPSAWSTEILGAVDQIANNILLLGGGLALAVFVGWVMAGPIEEVSEGASGVRWFGSWRNLLRYAVPAFLFFVLVYDAIPSTFETIINLF
jgi:NSS family neurotransmitter:Na+ symporter